MFLEIFVAVVFISVVPLPLSLTSDIFPVVFKLGLLVLIVAITPAETPAKVIEASPVGLSSREPSAPFLTGEIALTTPARDTRPLSFLASIYCGALPVKVKYESCALNTALSTAETRF